MQRGPITYIGNAFDTGELFKDFIKPLSFPAVVFSSFLGQSFVFLMVRGIPVFVFGAVFIGILFPAPGFIILFIFSLLVSFFLYFIMEFILAQFIFFVKGYYGIIALWQMLIFFTSGSMIPMPFMPAVVKSIIFVLPFHCLYFTPINYFLGGKMGESGLVIWLNRLGVHFTLCPLLEQVLWLAVLLPVAKLSWDFSKKRLLVYGG
jgi:ABC-2 type transport system permease protein